MIKSYNYNIKMTFENACKRRIRNKYSPKMYMTTQETFLDDEMADFQEEILFTLGDPISIWVRQ